MLATCCWNMLIVLLLQLNSTTGNKADLEINELLAEKGVITTVPYVKLTESMNVLSAEIKASSNIYRHIRI